MAGRDSGRSFVRRLFLSNSLLLFEPFYLGVVSIVFFGICLVAASRVHMDAMALVV